jgi:predicted permease
LDALMEDDTLDVVLTWLLLAGAGFYSILAIIFLCVADMRDGVLCLMLILMMLLLAYRQHHAKKRK